MSPGTLYHHFPSKEALIEAIILEDQERALTHFREPLEGVGLVDYLVESTIAVTREDCAQRALVVEIMAEGMRNPQVAEMLTNKYHTIIASLVARFNDAQAKGEIGADVDKEMAARLLLATTYGVLSDSSSAESPARQFCDDVKNYVNRATKMQLCKLVSVKIRVRFIRARYHLVCLIIFR